MRAMLARPIVPGLYVVPLGAVNAFLLEGDGLTLIDTGVPGSGQKIVQAIGELGRQPGEILQILITHGHPDHAGGLAELQALTPAPTYAHLLDAPEIRAGQVSRPLRPPTLLTWLLFQLLLRRASPHYPPARVDHELNGGDELPIAGGLQVIHAPGHSAGQVVFFWPRHGGVLFAADACGNLPRLGYSIGYEDLALGQQTLAKLATYDFEIACFGHGSAILSKAAQRFRAKWGKTPA
jgi:glyoxylase-like metal-dependent hydrolase (beta-lactamase superfamily II)